MFTVRDNPSNETENVKTILILSPDRFYRGVGGLCTQLRETINGFYESKLPFKFWVITPEKEPICGPNYEVIPIIGLNCMTMTPFNEYLSVINKSGAYVAAAMDYINKHGKPDLIHAFDWGTFTAAHLLSYYLQIPFIVSIALSIQKEVSAYKKHYSSILTMESAQMQVFQVACMIEATGMHNAFRVLFNTRQYAQMVAGPFYFKSHVIPNGVPFGKIQSLKVPDDFLLPGRPYAKKLVFLGRLTLSKNILSVLEAKLPPNVDLIIIGSEKLGAEINIVNAVSEASRDRDEVHYVGAKYDDEKFRWLKKADAVIMPSIHEPFGIVALEALSSGCVLLCSIVDGLAEFINDTVAINCGTSPETISEAIFRWTSLTSEEEASYIQKGLDHSSHFSWKSIALRTANEVYNSVLNHNNKETKQTSSSETSGSSA